MLTLETPTKLRVTGVDIEKVRRVLTYVSKSADFEYRRFRNGPGGRYYLNKYGEEALVEKLDELKAARNVCLLEEDGDGYWTYPGLRQRLEEHRLADGFENKVRYDLGRPYAWDKDPYPLRPYQKAAFDKLLEANHAGVAVGTGLGKSLIIKYLVRTLGLRTVIMAPTTSIATQLYKDLKEGLGAKHVGMFGDGKKHSKKNVVVGIAASLTRVEPGSEHYDNLASAQVFIADESHLCPADTLERVCTGLCAKAPFRFFFSGTQTRNDGSEMLLDGITGPIVYNMSVREGVDQGWLAKPNFHMWRLAWKWNPRFSGKDVNDITREHYLYNPVIARLVVALANRDANEGKQVLILIDEVEQMRAMMGGFKHKIGFAHGGSLSPKAKDALPPEFHSSDPEKLVDTFNAGNLSILIGTSCINTGTDIRPVNTLINFQGGKSPIKFPQTVGRGTRRTATKTEFDYHDFAVRCVGLNQNEDSVFRHALERAAIYNDIYGPVHWEGKEFNE
jgi:superfamily II DNA or RNA helicase